MHLLHDFSTLKFVQFNYYIAVNRFVCSLLIVCFLVIWYVFILLLFFTLDVCASKDTYLSIKYLNKVTIHCTESVHRSKMMGLVCDTT